MSDPDPTAAAAAPSASHPSSSTPAPYYTNGWSTSTELAAMRPLHSTFKFGHFAYSQPAPTLDQRHGLQTAQEAAAAAAPAAAAAAPTVAAPTAAAPAATPDPLLLARAVHAYATATGQRLLAIDVEKRTNAIFSRSHLLALLQRDSLVAEANNYWCCFQHTVSSVGGRAGSTEEQAAVAGLQWQQLRVWIGLLHAGALLRSPPRIAHTKVKKEQEQTNGNTVGVSDSCASAAAATAAPPAHDDGDATGLASSSTGAPAVEITNPSGARKWLKKLFWELLRHIIQPDEAASARPARRPAEGALVAQARAALVRDAEQVRDVCKQLEAGNRLLSAAEYDLAMSRITALLDELRPILPPDHFDGSIELRVTPAPTVDEDGAATPAQPFVWRHGIPSSPPAAPAASSASSAAASIPALPSAAAALNVPAWARQLPDDGAEPVPPFNTATHQCSVCQKELTNSLNHRRHYHKNHTQNFVCNSDNNPGCPGRNHRAAHGHKSISFGSKYDLLSHLDRSGKSKQVRSTTPTGAAPTAGSSPLHGSVRGSTSWASSSPSSAAAAAAGMGSSAFPFSPPLPTDHLPALVPLANSAASKGTGRGLFDEGVFGADDINSAAPKSNKKCSPRVAPSPMVELPVPDLPPDLSQVPEGDEEMAPELQQTHMDAQPSHSNAAAAASPPAPLLPAIATLAEPVSQNAPIDGPVPMDITGPAAPALSLGAPAPSVPPPTAPVLSVPSTPSLTAPSTATPVPSALGNGAAAAAESDTDSEDEAPLPAPATAVRSSSPRQLGRSTWTVGPQTEIARLANATKSLAQSPGQAAAQQAQPESARAAAPLAAVSVSSPLDKAQNPANATQVSPKPVAKAAPAIPATAAAATPTVAVTAAPLAVLPSIAAVPAVGTSAATSPAAIAPAVSTTPATAAPATAVPTTAVPATAAPAVVPSKPAVPVVVAPNVPIAAAPTVAPPSVTAPASAAPTVATAAPLPPAVVRPLASVALSPSQCATPLPVAPAPLVAQKPAPRSEEHKQQKKPPSPASPAAGAAQPAAGAVSPTPLSPNATPMKKREFAKRTIPLGRTSPSQSNSSIAPKSPALTSSALPSAVAAPKAAAPAAPAAPKAAAPAAASAAVPGSKPARATLDAASSSKETDAFKIARPSKTPQPSKATDAGAQSLSVPPASSSSSRVPIPAKPAAAATATATTTAATPLPASHVGAVQQQAAKAAVSSPVSVSPAQVSVSSSAISPPAPTVNPPSSASSASKPVPASPAAPPAPAPAPAPASPAGRAAPASPSGAAGPVSPASCPPSAPVSASKPPREDVIELSDSEVDEDDMALMCAQFASIDEHTAQGVKAGKQSVSGAKRAPIRTDRGGKKQRAAPSAAAEAAAAPSSAKGKPKRTSIASLASPSAARARPSAKVAPRSSASRAAAPSPSSAAAAAAAASSSSRKRARDPSDSDDEGEERKRGDDEHSDKETGVGSDSAVARAPRTSVMTEAEMMASIADGTFDMDDDEEPVKPAKKAKTTSANATPKHDRSNKRA